MRISHLKGEGGGRAGLTIGCLEAAKEFRMIPEALTRPWSTGPLDGSRPN